MKYHLASKTCKAINASSPLVDDVGEMAASSGWSICRCLVNVYNICLCCHGFNITSQFES